MKKIIFLISFLFVFITASLAQPINDDCANAITLTNLNNFCSNNAQYTNVGATASGFASPTCWAGYNNEVWFQFTAQATDVNITIYGNVSGNGTLNRPQIALFSGDCTTTTELACKTSPAGTNFVSLYKGGLTIGTNYLIRVDAAGTNTGTFKLCINNYTPSVAPGQDCSTASFLCNKNTINVTNLNGAGTNNQESAGSCLDSRFFPSDPIETNSVWYTWTAATTGTLTFDITPTNPTDDIDFVLYEFTGALCGAKTAIRCMASSCTSPTSATGLNLVATDVTEPAGCGPPAPPSPLYVQYANLTAGKNYGLLINNFTSANQGFTLSFGGTATFAGPIANFNSSANVCVGAPITFTDASTGAATYNWNFGAGATPATANTAGPHNVTYSSVGTKTIVLTITGATGCQVVISKTITVDPIPTVTVNSPTICPGATATLTANGASTYTWSAGATATGVNTATASPAATTSYTVTGTSSGCSNTAVATVTLSAPLAITVNSPTICNGQIAALTANGGTTYSWTAGATSTGVNTANASPTTTTSYTVTGTTGGCTGTAVATVTVNPNPVVTVNSPTICSGITTTLTANGATSYTWSAGATSTGVNTATANPSTTTSYTVTGTSAGCTGTAVSTVTVNPIPTVTVNSPSICPGTTATLTANGATSYTWSAGATSTGVNTATASPAATTSYTVTGTSLGCSNTAVSTVTIAASLGITVNSPTICNGQIAALTANGGTTYSWTAGAASTGVNTADASPTTTTSYTVTGTTGGCTGTAVATVTVNPNPIVTVNSPTICNGITTTLTANGATSYTWSAGPTSTGVNTATANPSTTTSYTVTGTSSGCTGTAVSTVTVNPIPTVTVNSPSICPGSTATLTANGATSYTWSAGATTTGVNTATASPVATTSYTVTGTSLGCSNTVVAVVTINSALSVDAGLNDTICYGGSANLSVTPNGGGYTYSWTPSATLSNATIPNPIASPVATTTYSVTVTDANGCTGSNTVIIYADPQINLAVSGISTLCNGSCDGQTNVIPSGGSNDFTGSNAFAWSSGCTTASCNNQCTGTYSLIVTDSWGCSATGSATVSSPSAVTATSSYIDATCYNACNGTATTTGSGGTPTAGGTYNYSWNTNPVQNTQTSTGLCAGTYTCTVTDANGCAAAPVIVTIAQPTAVTIATIPPVTICASGNTTLTANVSGGSGTYNYSWSPSSGLSSTTISNPVASPTTTTTYTLNVTDGNLCPAQTMVTVTVNPPLSIVSTDPAPMCPGASTIISATASNGAGSGYTYSWLPATGLNNPLIRTPQASPTTTTTYTVTANDGCSLAVTSTVSVTILPVPNPEFTSTPRSGCDPLCVDFTDASAISSGSIKGWKWNFGDPSSPNSVSGSTASHCFTMGTYSVTLTDTSALGCVATSIPKVITVYPNPVANISAPLSTSILNPTVQYIDESTIAAGNITKWHWEFGDILSDGGPDTAKQNPTHTFSEVGSYCAELIVTSNKGCVDTTSYCIVIDPEFTFYIPNAFSPNDDGKNDEFYGKGDGIKTLEMAIYNRWGNLVFYTNDITKHWDGKAVGGSEVAQQDTYVYVIKIKDHTGEKHTYTGAITIVK